MNDKAFSLQLAEDVHCTEDYIEKRLEISYITKENTVDTRPIHIVCPKRAKQPMPLVFVAHYPIEADASEIQKQYLKHGWATASVIDFDLLYNKQLTDNNFVFNNAVLYTLKNMPEFDRNRIAVVGGSAGGYTALMLSALHLGICCTVANSPVTNLPFTFHEFFPKTYEMHMKSREPYTPEEIEKFLEMGRSSDIEVVKKGKTILKYPIAANVAEAFMPCTNNFKDKNDVERCTALSPVGYGKCYSNPLILSHYTSDTLVPIDQITKKYTYPKPGKSLPQDVNFFLPKTTARTIDCAFDEVLPAEKTYVRYQPASDETIPMPYDRDYAFNINIFDEGPMEGYAGHRLMSSNGGLVSEEYLMYNMEKGAGQTVWLSVEKLKNMLNRYSGGSIPLPHRSGVHENLYGSPTIYRKEIAEELQDFAKNHTAESINAVMDALLNGITDREHKEKLQTAYQKIMDTFC